MELTFIDIDETLFFTKANVLVKNKQGKLLNKLTNKEFNNYSLKKDETFDFSEFSSSDIFINTSKENGKMIDITKKMLNNSKVFLLTARPDFDNKHKLLNYMRNKGLDVGHMKDNKIHILRAGNIEGYNTSEKKFNIIKKYINSNVQAINFYDDDINNVLKIKELETTDIKCNTYLVEEFNIRKI